jgi:hypothetical protein
VLDCALHMITCLNLYLQFSYRNSPMHNDLGHFKCWNLGQDSLGSPKSSVCLYFLTCFFSSSSVASDAAECSLLGLL